MFPVRSPPRRNFDENTPAFAGISPPWFWPCCWRPLRRGPKRVSNRQASLPVPRPGSLVHGSAQGDEPTGQAGQRRSALRRRFDHPRLGNQGGRGLEEILCPRNALNLGTAGDRTQHVLWRLRNGNLDGISPRLAVVMIGTNNSAAGDKPEDTAAGVKAIVSELRTRLPKTKVLLLAIFPRGDNDTTGKANTEVNALLAKLADGKMVHFLDIGPSFVDKDGKVRKDLISDGVHPNEKGHQVWAENRAHGRQADDAADGVRRKPRRPRLGGAVRGV